jgi:pimeloyl-ACP methyl ester carboxylesterase
VAIQALTDARLRSEYADVIERIEAVVLLSPLDMALEKPIPMFQEIARMGAVKVDLSDAFGIMQDRVGQAVLDSVVDQSYATREEANKRIQVLRDPERRRAMQAMLKQTTPWEKDATPDWDAIDERISAHRDFPARCLIMWGRRDEILPLSMGYKLAVELGATLVIFDQSKHSIHVDAPVEASRVMREFLEVGRIETADGQEVVDLSATSGVLALPEG